MLKSRALEVGHNLFVVYLDFKIHQATEIEISDGREFAMYEFEWVSERYYIAIYRL